ncbi:MAG: hypothetical protein GW939_02300 [Candidatus Magasanikbacteria bacterium]|uniref:Uncharacterized protein n=1 Tax=Candidatus Magasanikbacteria bacterium CG10_big_fil_rev_8_21_14_0_10_38_6 TaxID=1974647 RepID=A0A2M6P2G8_9BACT|nr:hypothetical protein [Candidatus Magasanikbacteria bacterium]NCS72126.1 hypothetical protein [Candidatus Magasanikbacteria bacterium]PIR77630.1 MAG: hypothetical protein COU30_01395 [Candidatus Magasanikbacteria bacterium CG10_big_fil_rev_8_21_14_0_10_38_6]
MPRHTEPVSIQSPPLTEFKKKRSCVKRTCFSGCGCLGMFIIGIVLLLQLTAPVKPKRLSEVPAVFPDTIFLYDDDYIEEITFLPAEQKGRPLEAATFLPKLILSPILLTFDQYTTLDSGDTSLTFNNMVQLANESVTKRDDTVTVVWKNLPADPDFIFDYYRRQFEEQAIEVTEREDTLSQKRLQLTADTFYGMLTITDESKDQGTTSMTLVVSVPHTD